MGSELDLTCLESLEKEVTLNSGMDVDPVDDNDNDNHCNELDLDITVELSSTNGKDGNDSQLSSATTIGSMTFASQHEVEDRIPQRLTETDKPEGKDTDGEDFAAEVDIEVELEPEDNRPVISVRNFAEIAENDDEEDGASDDDDIFIIEEVSLNRNEISASDLKRMSLDLTVEEEMHDLGSFYRVPNLDELRIEFFKLRKALMERMKNRESEATRRRNFPQGQPLIRMTPSAPSPITRYQMARGSAHQPPGSRFQFPAPRSGISGNVRPRGPVPIRPSPASSRPRPRNGVPPAGQVTRPRPPNPSGGGGGGEIPLSPTISIITTDGSNSNNVVTIPPSQYQIVQAPPSAPYSVRPGSQMQITRQLIPATYGRVNLPQGQDQSQKPKPNGNLCFSSKPQSQVILSNQQLIRLPSGIQIEKVSSANSNINNNNRFPNPERGTHPQPQFFPQLNNPKPNPQPQRPQPKQYPGASVPKSRPSRDQPPPPPPPPSRTVGKENVAFQIQKVQQNQDLPEEIITAGTLRPLPGTLQEDDNINNEGSDKKTFPSLIVQVKPCLTAKPGPQFLAKSRKTLDSKVKEALQASPSKFTEWLIRRGLLKVEQRCVLYPQGEHVQPMKLGMYADNSKEAFSGGYVWSADCCPGKQVSVFKGSIFEGSKYPPGTLLKLIYHWACQTPVENVMLWVKIPSVFLKNFYTMLRAVCILWLHEKCPLLGGEMKYVEIGVITLGGSAETQKGRKSVKIEILGVFDPATKMVRLKVINVLHGMKSKGGNVGVEAEQGARAFQILWALTHWVDRRSTLLVDEIIDKTLFTEMGFTSVIQSSQKEQKKGAPTNANVMNYLRHFVPKIFSSTLTVLSKSIIQQFLDELCWRERHDHNTLQTYESIIDHIVEITMWDIKDGMSLISRLSKVRENPFVDCSVTKQTIRSPLNTIPISLRVKPGIRECINYIMKVKLDMSGSLISGVNHPLPVNPTNPRNLQASAASSSSSTLTGQKRKLPKPQTVGEIITLDDDVHQNNYQDKVNYFKKAPKVLNIDRFYYGRSEAQQAKHWSLSRFTFLKCPLCPKTFALSNRDIIRHLGVHVSGLQKTLELSLCQYCLQYNNVPLKEHLEDSHYFLKSPQVCMICELQFKTEMELTIHMWELHVEAEAPYSCAVCDFSSSFHTEVVDHFGDVHGAIGYVMCPYCLKVLAAKTNGNLQTIVVHLQAHQLKRTKKCPKCVLSFANEDDLRHHLSSSHSTKNGILGRKWLPYSKMLPYRELHPLVTMAKPPALPSPMSGNMKPSSISSPARAPPFPPKKKRKLSEPRKNPKSALPIPELTELVASLNAPLSLPIPGKINEKFGGSMYNICVPKLENGKALCYECGLDITIPNHFIGRLRCTKCVYVTACEAAMNLHHEVKHGEASTFGVVEEKSKSGRVLKGKKLEMLSNPLVCQCGFLSKNPNVLAEHLVQCGKYTVFPIPNEGSSISRGIEKTGEDGVGIVTDVDDGDDTQTSTIFVESVNLQEVSIASLSQSLSDSPKGCK